MAEKTNIWDGVVYTGKYSSGTTLYADNDLTIFYVIPLIEGHDYKIVFNESHNRRRIVTTLFDPAQSTGTGIRALVETNSPTIPYELDFTAATNENYLFVYVSNVGETPAISAHDMSVPDYDRKYLIRIGTTLYTITDGNIAPLETTELTAEVFRTYGFDTLPTGAFTLDGVADPELLYWHDSTDALPTLTAAVTGSPPVPQVVVTESFDMSDSTILGIESVTVEASDDVLWAVSFDDGATWKAYDGTQWGVLDQENSGMTAETFQNISVESWAAVVSGDHYRIRFVLMDTASYVASLTIHYLNEEV